MLRASTYPVARGAMKDITLRTDMRRPMTWVLPSGGYRAPMKVVTMGDTMLYPMPRRL